MVDGTLIELSIGLFAAILIIREVLTHVRSMRTPNTYKCAKPGETAVMKNNIDVMSTHIQTIKDKIDDLYEWHNQRDKDGVMRWFFRQENIVRLSEDVKQLCDVMVENTAIQKKILTHLERQEQRFFNYEKNVFRSNQHSEQTA